MHGKITLEREEVYKLCMQHVMGILGMPIGYHLTCTNDYGTVTVFLEKDEEPANPVPVPPAPDDLVNTLKQIATIETE